LHCPQVHNIVDDAFWKLGFALSESYAAGSRIATKIGSARREKCAKAKGETATTN